MIRFGMKLPEIFNQLVRGYQKVRGQKPEGLDLIKIKQEAMQKFQEMRKILDMQGKPIDPSKPIIGGTQQGNALKSGIMKATGAGPEVVEGINPKFIDFTINSFKNMDGIKVMKEANKVIKREGPYKDLTKNDAKRIMDAVDDKLKNIDMDPEDMYASGGRAGFKDGEGIMQMASAPEPMDERNMVMENIAIKEFGKPLKDLNEEEIIEIEIMIDEMTEKPNRGAQSIKLADGGITRIGLKDGKGMFESLFYNKERPILSGLNTTALFDLAHAITSGAGPLLGLADGGRAAFKDGPKDPRRRGFMKAAVGVASMLPFGIGKGVKMAAPAIEKAVDISGPALAKIVETVMSLGKTISQSGRRVKEMITKKKHKGIEVEEDIMDGSYTIKKGGKEIYYKPGRQDEMGIDDDIIEVIEKTVTKKASGGVARLLGE
jgi:hypothetical protein